MKLNPPLFFGFFLISAALLMYEILLARIFSITMDYYLAYVGISVCLFGLTAGALIVYLFPDFFTSDRLSRNLTLTAQGGAISLIFSLLTLLCLPFVTVVTDQSIVGIYSLFLIYFVASIPFIFLGACICLMFANFQNEISRVYAVNLAGSALGCYFIVCLLQWMDGLTAAIAIASLIAIAAVFFAAEKPSKKLFRISGLISIVLICASLGHTILVHRQTPLLRLVWTKEGRDIGPILFEKWNLYSRLIITGEPESETKLYGWGYSPIYETPLVKSLTLNMDGDPAAPLFKFDGNLKNLEHLKYYLPNLAHYLRPDSDVLVLGVGGGRDLLSALAFKQKSVIGIEIDKNIIEILTQKFGDYTGHLDQNPKVRLVSEEARNYIVRQKKLFDIIQTSLIDTKSAKSPGVGYFATRFVYTLEAWKTFLEHLNPDGILTFSRAYRKKDLKMLYRLTALAADSLQTQGITDTKNHIILVNFDSDTPNENMNITTILISKKPFSDQDINLIEQIVNKMNFNLLLSPRFSFDSNFTALASGEKIKLSLNGLPVDLNPPTDDKPFLQHMFRFRDLLNPSLWKSAGVDKSARLVLILSFLAIIVIFLALISIVLPLALKSTNKLSKADFLSLAFFGFIGFGFVFIEITEAQQWDLFLGNPTYSLSIVLCSLLLGGGLGSYLTQKIKTNQSWRSNVSYFFVSFLIIVSLGMITSPLTRFFHASDMFFRIFFAATILLLLGTAMGIAFPIGIKALPAQSKQHVPWFWGINGATCACASVIVIIVNFSIGLAASYWVGCLFYLAAFAIFSMLSLSRKN